jgi:hypothetical protein
MPFESLIADTAASTNLGYGQAKAGIDIGCLGCLVCGGSAGHLVLNPLAPFLQALGMVMA